MRWRPTGTWLAVSLASGERPYRHTRTDIREVANV